MSDKRKYTCLAGVYVRLLVLLVFVTAVSSQRNGASRNTEVVCSKIEIRNSVEYLNELENCTVIEGHLHILLIDSATNRDYEKYSFPKLVEITDYVLLYRAFGLRSLQNLFPNLAVIRGQKLFNNYALVVYEMTDLENLGLVSLTSIMRGAVRLEKNKKLCYIDTIDWTRVASSVDIKDHFFQENKDEQECVNVCPNKCDETTVSGTTAKRCWTPDDCQQNLQCDHCKGKYDSGFCQNGRPDDCCDPLCIGGCTGSGRNQCIACRNVTYKGTCEPGCPPGTYMYMKRRCLLDTECINIKQKISRPPKWKIIRHERTGEPGQCVDECPPGYSVNENDPTECTKCEGYCPKECPGKTVDSIESAQELKGCTKIDGPLEIMIIAGSNIGVELEESLGMIVEVTRYIKIVRSYVVLSLSFFKSLRVIHGKKLEYNDYSLVVMENVNLQELFPKDVSENLKIKNGKAYFHFNRKLCYSKIEKFLNHAHVNFTENDVSKRTNGDQIPCSVKKMSLKVTKIEKEMALLEWDKFEQVDPRELLGYVINYREAETQDINIHQGRDACMDTVWKTKDVSPANDDRDSQVELLWPLKPWTQYAVYIQTYTLKTANEAANSELIFFTTLPYEPSVPVDLEVFSDVQGELRVTWKPPKKPNGPVTHYIVYWQLQELNTEPFDKRDYCKNPIVMQKKERERPQEEKTKYLNHTQLTDGECCACPKSKEKQEIEQRMRQQQIEFENDLHDKIYKKRRSSSSNRRSRRAVDDFGDIDDDGENGFSYNIPPTTAIKNTTLDNKNISLENNSTDNTTRHVYHESIVYGTEIIIPNLGHFQEYNIEVLACQESDPESGEKYCSRRAMTTARTLRSLTADNINESTVRVQEGVNNTMDGVLVQWESPKHPNGLIITFQIEYKKVSTADAEPNRICFTHKKYRKLGGYLFQRLQPGNYSFRIRATSLAGNGSYTEYFSFFVHSKTGSQVPVSGPVIAVIVIAIIVVLVITSVAVWFVAKSKFARDPEVTTVSMNPGYVPSADVYIADDWEVDREKVKLLRELGQGSFGMVYEGIAKDVEEKGEVKVAVKTVNDNAEWHDRMMFLKEASIMKTFSCHHVVKLLGVVSKGQPVLVIMELMAQGDLKNFLRMHRPDEEENVGRNPPTVKEILQMAGEIADGMAYLADKKFVHRDLAARNCMVAESKTVKIGDFGMTRDIYETDYYRKGGKGLLPVRWMAPESLKDGIFTTTSDVWSYGVVLWEMATLAAQPYQGLSNEEVLKYVADGRRMEKPDGCPEKIYDLMCQCWNYRYKRRPTFKEIIEILVPDLDPSFKHVSYFFSEENKTDANEYTEDQGVVEVEEIDFEQSDDEEMDINDESRIPFMSFINSKNINSVEMQRSPSQHSQRDASGTSPCECVLMEEVPNGHRNSTCSSPNSGVGSSDGSKGSSKSSNSSYNTQINGIANGHIHMRFPRTTPC